MTIHPQLHEFPANRLTNRTNQQINNSCKQNITSTANVSRCTVVTDEIEAVREPAGDVCGTVVDDRQVHEGKQRRVEHPIDIVVVDTDWDLVSGDVQ